MSRRRELGAVCDAEGTACFRVWGPLATRIEVVHATSQQRYPLFRDGEYHVGRGPGLREGADYWLDVDGRLLPDPASRWQPGVHGPSRIVSLRHDWRDQAWRGRRLEDCVLYELHVGTFTEEGTFDAAIADLDRLAEMGITAVELMPVAQCPGARNWGYDGVYPFAVQDSFGGPAGLMRFVDACHARGLAVVLDVVFNHLGPEGNYLGIYAPFFTDRYRTPWGDAINFDGEGSDGVRDYFIQCALQWIEDYHVDGLRLDAVHAIYDASASTFVEELTRAVHRAGEAAGRWATVVAESDLNDPSLVRPVALGGRGLDGMWCDDLHHVIHVCLTGERDGYYADFRGVADLACALEQGAVLTGRYSEVRQRRHGRPFESIDATQLVVCAQNHDQVGNRMLGERLVGLVGPGAARVAAALLLTSTGTPLLFMGEELGESRPFQYFTSHGDPGLIEAVRRGRRAEFEAFAWQGIAPDPQAESTFLASKLGERHTPLARETQAYYSALLQLRPRLRGLPRRAVAVSETALVVQYGEQFTGLFALGRQPELLPLLSSEPWRVLLNSAASQLGGEAAPSDGERIQGEMRLGGHSAVLLERVAP